MQFDEKLTKELIFKKEILRVETYENSSRAPIRRVPLPCKLSIPTKSIQKYI
jgi:hypothetical protein